MLVPNLKLFSVCSILNRPVYLLRLVFSSLSYLDQDGILLKYFVLLFPPLNDS